MQSIKTGLEKGLARKQTAPAFTARTRRLSSGKAVMKINGASLPRARIFARRSKPFISGIRTSAMTHDTSSRRPDCKNSTADANVCTRYPCELRRLLVAPRTDASSSMTEITEGAAKTDLPEVGARCLTWYSPDAEVSPQSGLGNHTKVCTLDVFVPTHEVSAFWQTRAKPYFAPLRAAKDSIIVPISSGAIGAL